MIGAFIAYYAGRMISTGNPWTGAAVILLLAMAGCSLLGIGIERCHGVKRGVVRDIEETTRAVRDALAWSKYANETIDMYPDVEVAFASHHWPTWGKANIRAFLKDLKHEDAVALGKRLLERAFTQAGLDLRKVALAGIVSLADLLEFLAEELSYLSKVELREQAREGGACGRQEALGGGSENATANFGTFFGKPPDGWYLMGMAAGLMMIPAAPWRSRRRAC